MQKLNVHEAAPGMVLAKTLFNERGDPLLRAGVALTKGNLTMLERRGLSILYVRDEDPDADDDDVDDFVGESIRQHAFQQVRSIYVQIGHLARPALQLPLERRVDALTRLPGFKALESHKFFDPLIASVSDLVDETMNVRVFINLINTHAHDTYTYFHYVDMAIVAVMLGRRIGLPRATLRQLALGSMLHEIGVQLLPPHIMEKEGEFSHEEWEQVRQHPVLGYELLQRTGLNSSDMLPKHIALQHHERQDGSGYPRGLTGANETRPGGSTPPGRILPIAEIAAIADVYDALRADRPHRPAFPPEQIVAILRQSAGHHLNRALVETLLSIMPLYPTDSPVVVTSPGPYQGCLGVVTSTLPESLARPRVRLVRDADGRPMGPIRLDLTKDPTLAIASPEAAPDGQSGAWSPQQ